MIGASNHREHIGSIVLHNLVSNGFGGTVYAVNPEHSSIDGTPCFATVPDLPAAVDLAVICTPATTVPQVVRECGEVGIRGLAILSAGFRQESREAEILEQAVHEAAAAFDGLRIICPNCLGIISPHVPLNVSLASELPSKGSIAFISQSGAPCRAILDRAIEANVGFSHFVSTGNMLDVEIADLIDYFANDKWTDSIVLYVESINEPRRFMSAARAFTRTKPIIAYKSGGFCESTETAASSTGAMPWVDSVYEAAMARAGIVRVADPEELFDCAELLSRQKTPSGQRLAVLTNAGGPGVIAANTLLEHHGSLAQLADDTITRLNEQLPHSWSHGNPVDILEAATPERFESAVDIISADQGVDGVLVVLSPQAMTDSKGVAKAVIDATKRSGKPILAAWMDGETADEGMKRLRAAGIPTYSSPERGVRAFMHLVAYRRNRETLYETPREVPREFPLDHAKLRAVFDTIRRDGLDVLSETQSKALLQAYEIPVTETYVARSKEDARKHVARVGFPVALKILSPDIDHNTEIGVVELTDGDDVAEAYDRMLCGAKERFPDARLDSVTVRRLFVDPNARELIVGANRDPVFGMVLVVGVGGAGGELLRDRALELPPLSEHLARRMLESLRSWPLLQGYQRRPGVNIERLVEVLMRLSYLVADYPEIAELEVNPLLATSEDAIALDARIVLERDAATHPLRPYAHLAIRPYPVEFTKHTELPEGTAVLLRPIKPEDEPMWHDLVGSCSPESLHLRFRYMFKATTHEMATRFCFIDYDRELAIVAEIAEDNQRRLIGVGRLVADVDHNEAEYAILVSDPWQGVGLGTLLTDYCLEICKHWGIRRVVAEIAPENDRMIRMFAHRGFDIDRSNGRDVVIARKSLASQPTA